jgi:GDP-4-dehydro-6-deoxy-D-mannose reductase
VTGSRFVQGAAVNAVITGVTGFLGSFLAEHLLAEGDRVLGISRRGVWPAFIPAQLQQAVPLTRWDANRSLRGTQVKQQILRFQPDCIYHLAALSGPSDCGELLPNALAAAVNIGGTAAVLELAAQLPRKPRVLFSSTSHVYDPQSAAGGRVSEQSPVAPQRGYGWSKWLAEAMIVPFALDRGVEVIVARSFQHTGPRQLLRTMLPDWAWQFVGGDLEPVRVHNLTTTIDLSDVRDVVRAYRLLMVKGQPGEVYNVGSGVALENGAVFEILRELAGPDRKFIELNPGVHYNPVADIARLVACTGWQPQIRLTQTVADTLGFWQEHKLHLGE